VVARFGGEEFVVAMAPQPPDDAGMVAERLRLSICDRPFQVGDKVLDVSISIGVAVAIPDSTVDGLAATADIALYRAKAGGRNRVEIAEAADWVTRAG